MGIDIRLPNITASTERGQLEQIRSYLYQFAESLKYSLDVIELNTNNAVIQAKTASGSVSKPTPEQNLQQFNNLKNLIISSADIVEAYSEEISYRLSGQYVAQSDFGTYREETIKQVEENSQNLTAYYTRLEKIDEVQKTTEGFIRTGYITLENGEKVVGVEIGQKSSGDVEDNEKSGFVRFLPTKTVFYDERGNQMAVLSNRELFIDGIVCKGKVYINNFVIEASVERGLSIKPTGRVI